MRTRELSKISYLLDCIESCALSMKIKTMVYAWVLNCSDLVHMLMSHKCKTFDDHAEKVFLPHMLEQLESVVRLDIIWNPYLRQSLKQATRRKKGSSCRMSVKECTSTS